MKKNLGNLRKPAGINTSRWAAYAAAGAASSVGCAATADANTITYSGPINQHFQADYHQHVSGHFQLDRPGDSFTVSHIGSGDGAPGAARFRMDPTLGSAAGMRGRYANYLSKLNSGQNVSVRPFVRGGGTLAIAGTFYSGNPSKWLEGDTGFVGFRFNSGTGVQYGWARIEMDAAGVVNATNSFTLIDYAFAGPGERIRAGQTTQSVPESGGSLGLLALGCAGLLAWRARWRQAEPS